MFRTIRWYFKFIFMLFITYPRLKKAEYFLKKNKLEKFYNYSFFQTSKWAMNRIKDSGATINVYGKENIPKDRNVVFISNHQGDFDIAIFMALIPKEKGFVAKIELTINVYGKENIPKDRNVVFISNHQGDFDIAIFMALIPKEKGFVAKIELNKIPILRTWMKYIGCVFMDRKDLKQSLKTINKAIDFIKKGHSMVIFPEGTRSKCDKIGDFKPGSFKLAFKTNTPIVPVTIDGSYKLKEKNNGLIKPDTVNVYIHNPIFLENITNEEKESLPGKIKDIIADKLPKNN